MQFYDMHSHILPAFDDGAKTVEDSLQLIDCLRKQGVTNICLTPHFYTNEMSYEEFLKKREEAFRRFEPYIPEDIHIVLGTEVFMTSYILNNEDLSKITYGQSRYILTELGYSSTFSERTMYYFYALMENFRLIPVLPHVERYEHLMDHPDMIEELRDMGIVIQSNISNYADKAPFLKKRKMMKLMQNGLIDILGTDAHSFTHNTPELYSQAIKNIADKCGKHRVNRLMSKAQQMFFEASGIDIDY